MSENDEPNFNHFGKMIIPLLQNRDSTSPPKAQVDDASLQLAMDRNKESLKVKLMTRRPITQLVEQGIMPSLKVPPHFHEQRQKLERAKMGDFLKNKIQRRPDRQELIQQHILEDTTVDPSLQDKQRQLKKARLADDLNDRLSHRPGPLELVKGNILHADEKFAQAVKEGQIPFKRTCEGQSLKHPPPSFVFEEDSGSDVTPSPPQDFLDQSLTSLSSVDSMVSSPYSNQESPGSYVEPRVIQPTPISCIPSPASSPSSNFSQSEIIHKENVPTTRNRKKSKPKSQPKTRTIKFHEYKGPPSAQKIPTPPAIPEETSYELLLRQQQLFLQWQLEWQQKYPQMILPVPQQPTGDQNQNMNTGQSCTKEQSQEMTLPSPQKCLAKLEDMKVSDLKAELKRRNLPVSGSKPQLIERLKPHLDFVISSTMKKIPSGMIDSNTSMKTEANTMPINVGGIILDNLPTLVPKTEPVTSIVTMDTSANGSSPQMTMSENGSLMVYNTVPMQSQLVTTSRPSSAAPMDIEIHSPCSDAMDCGDSAVAMNENIVKLQQKRIQELQRELQKSQLQLQQQQWLQQQQQQAQQQALLASQPVPIAPAPASQNHQISANSSLPQTNIDTKALQRLQQHLQQKFQQQQLLQHLQQQATGNANAVKFPAGSTAMSAAVKANLAAFIHNQQNSNTRLTNVPATLNQHTIHQFPGGITPIVFCQPGTFPNGIEKPRANSLPSGLTQQRLLWTSSLPNFSAVITTKPMPGPETNEAKFVAAKMPPNYNEATKQLQQKVKQEQRSQCSNGTTKSRSGRKSVKSQAVDDVLEILIKNGELPASAAQDPATPTTPETLKSGAPAPPVFPSKTSSPPVPPPLPVSSNPMSNSVLPLNSLPSSVLQESDNGPNPSLEFDFNLELQDIEAMDLGVLENPHHEVSRESSSTSSSHASNSHNASQHSRASDVVSNSMDMDVELSDWLDVLVSSPSETQPMSSSANQQAMYSCSGDPLLSNMANNHDTFDMFSLDDMDFKTPSDLNILSWDKVDFAT